MTKRAKPSRKSHQAQVLEVDDDQARDTEPEPGGRGAMFGVTRVRPRRAISSEATARPSLV